MHCPAGLPIPKALPLVQPLERCSSAISPKMPELWGGSADLAESNNTTPEGEPSFLPIRPAVQAVSR